MNPPPTAPVPAGPRTQEMKPACKYFVMPNMPRDVWYGYPDKLESAQLVAFVEQRHAHIAKDFNAQYLADALNERAVSQSAPSGLAEENRRLRAWLDQCVKQLKHLKTLGESAHEAPTTDMVLEIVEPMLQTSAAPVGTRKEGT